MTEDFFELLRLAVKNRTTINNFRLTIKEQLGPIYDEGIIDSTTFDDDLLTRNGWSGERIYVFYLDAAVEQYIFLDRNDVIVGGLGLHE